jgi:N utilization substance protein B
MIGRRLLRIKVLQVLYACSKNEGNSIYNSDKELMFSLEKSNDLFYNILLLLTDIQDHAEHRIDLCKHKNIPSEQDMNPNTRFIENPILKKIKANVQFKNYTNSRELSWDDLQETPRIYFNKLIETEFYKEYMSAEEQTFQDHKKFVLDIITHLLCNNDDFISTMEERSIYWNDDFDFVFSMIIKTIKKIKEDDDEYANIPKLFVLDDEVDFAKDLLRKTLLKQVELREIIKENIVNWDVDRIASVDIQIMSLALCEIMNFPSIPVKVTFDEYIDIAKFYSTRKSSEFINGVLDKIVKVLQKEEKFAKAGRGLM